jgi:hypothetical protein
VEDRVMGAKVQRKKSVEWAAWKVAKGSIEDLCQVIVSGGHLAGFCASKSFSYSAVVRWIDDDAQRTALYERAREDRADRIADEIIAISDEDTVENVLDAEGNVVGVRFDATAVARNKLRIDARKWVVAKLKPKRYAERTTLAGDADAPLAVELNATIRFVEAKK